MLININGPSGRGEKSQTQTPLAVSSFFYTLTAELLLFLLLGLSACSGNFCVEEGEGGGSLSGISPGTKVASSLNTEH